MKFGFWIILFFGCSIGSCTKDEGKLPKPVKFLKVSDEVKEWGYFKPGSYWIIKDSCHNGTDSVYIISVTNSTVSRYTIDTAYIVEQITIKYNDSALIREYTLSSFLGDHIEIAREAGRFSILELDTSEFSGKFSGILENRNISEIIVSNIKFSDTRYVRFYYNVGRPSSPGYSYYGWMYWKKQVGIIKGSFISPFQPYRPLETCELIRYHVIQ